MSEPAALDVLIRGNLVLPDGILPGGALGIREERIVSILGVGEQAEAAKAIDYGDRFILPGLVDTHVHTLSTPAEGITATTAAAAAGGVTTIVDMPYDAPGPVTDVTRLREKIEAVRAEAIVDVGLYGTMRKRGGLSDLAELREAGVLAFKLSLYETDPVRFPRIEDGDLEAAFLELAGSGIPIVLHAELQEIVERRLALALEGGESDAGAHARTRPPVSETGAIAKALELAFWTGARIHIAHVTHPHGFHLVDWYRRQGAHVSAETCVQYLTLNEDDVAALGPIAKVNPPIRGREEQNGLWEELREGRIATVSTDHAPWPIETKRRPMLAATSGMPGLDTFLSVLHTEARRRDLPLTELARLTATQPAQIFGLADRKGSLSVGLDADLVVLDAAETWTFDAARSFSNAKWSPFHGRQLEGRVTATWVRGRQVYDGTEMLVEPGYGRWLQRPA